jgi:hypothetical protein
MERLKAEPDKGLQIAYASTLGKLQTKEAAPLLLDVLEDTRNHGARVELVLALVRIVGDEGSYIRLVRNARGEAGTTFSQAMTAFRRKISRDSATAQALLATIEQCADRFARNHMTEAVEVLAQLIRQLPPARYDQAAMTILETCANRLAQHQTRRMDYIFLAIHTIQVGWRDSPSA